MFATLIFRHFLYVWVLIQFNHQMSHLKSYPFIFSKCKKVKNWPSYSKTNVWRLKKHLVYFKLFVLYYCQMTKLWLFPQELPRLISITNQCMPQRDFQWTWFQRYWVQTMVVLIQIFTNRNTKSLNRFIFKKTFACPALSFGLGLG